MSSTSQPPSDISVLSCFQDSRVLSEAVINSPGRGQVLVPQSDEPRPGQDNTVFNRARDNASTLIVIDDACETLGKFSIASIISSKLRSRRESVRTSVQNLLPSVGRIISELSAQIEDAHPGQTVTAFPNAQCISTAAHYDPILQNAPNFRVSTQDVVNASALFDLLTDGLDDEDRKVKSMFEKNVTEVKEFQTMFPGGVDAFRHAVGLAKERLQVAYDDSTQNDHENPVTDTQRSNEGEGEEPLTELGSDGSISHDRKTARKQSGQEFSGFASLDSSGLGVDPDVR